MGESEKFQQTLGLIHSAPVEAERFVEDFKSASSGFDKYIDQGLSPMLPEFTFNSEKLTLQPNQDLNTFRVDSSLTTDKSEVDIRWISEVNEPPPTPVFDVQEPTITSAELLPEIKYEPKAEIIGEVAAGAVTKTKPVPINRVPAAASTAATR